MAELGTIASFAVRFDDRTFANLVAYDDAGRETHLAGNVGEAPMARAAELLSTAPQIRKADVLADKLLR